MLRHPMPKARHAFSLVELAIVLVILGLLAGGVLSGQSLIHAAELRSISTQYQNYAAAIQSFNGKYFAMPGDMPNAESFWDTDPDGCTGNTTQTPRKKTCNGNGDGKIGTGSICTAAEMTEAFRAWQHLANAGLIEGSYSGVSGPGRAGCAYASDVIPGTNGPVSKVSTVGWGIWYLAPESDISAAGAHHPFFPNEGTNVLTVGSRGDYAGMNDGPFMKTEDAWNLDSKMDDGKPLTGKVRGYLVGSASGYTPCTTGPTAADTYDFTNTSTTACGLEFLFQ